MKTSYKRSEDDRLWAYKWIVIVGLIVILFFWCAIVNPQSGIEYYKIIKRIIYSDL